MLTKRHIRRLKDTKMLIDYALHDPAKNQSIASTWLSVAIKNMQEIVTDLDADQSPSTTSTPSMPSTHITT